MAEKKKMSVAEILAAARKADGGGASAEPEATSSAPPDAAADALQSTDAAAQEATDASQESPEPAEAAPAAPAAKPNLKPGERPSIADILAMARGGGGTPAAAKPSPKPAEAAKSKPAAKAEAKPAAKPAAAAKGAAKPAERLSTASILASARGGTKPGPITKAEAAQKESVKPKAAPAAKLPVPPMPVKPAHLANKPGTSAVGTAAAATTAVATKSVAAKPSDKKTPAPVDEGRRLMIFGVLFGSFLAAGFTFFTTTMAMWTLAVARFMFPNILTEPPSRFRIGFPDEFPPSQVNEKFKSQFGVWVVNYEYHGTPEIYALSTVCTHLGCTPNWLEAEQKFKCPCHGSGFYKDGINFEGPAPRPLERYAVRIAEDGQLEIDKSKKFQQELGQWEDPMSFVHV